MTDAASQNDTPAWRGPAIALAKLGVVVLVGYFVADVFGDAWRQLRETGLKVHWGLAAASAAALYAAQAPMAWYWRQTLLALGQPAPLGPAIAAFYYSQIGKYVPGKAMVVVLRTERMLRWGGRGRLIAACVFIETLTIMAVGAVLAAWLLSSITSPDTPGRGWLIGLAMSLAVGCLAPTTPPVARRLIEWLAPPLESEDATLRRGLTWPLAAEGWSAASVAWVLMAVSVWLAAWSVGATDADGWRQPGLWLLAATLPVVAGFLSLVPAGAIVRDGLMLGLLSPALGEAGALATTLATRLLWIGCDVLACVILYGYLKSEQRKASDE